MSIAWAWCSCMSRAKPASAALGPGAPALKVENRPTANASAATPSPTRTNTHQRGRAERAGPLMGSGLLAGRVDPAGARGGGLGGVLVAPVLLEELLDAGVVDRVEGELVVPGREHERGRQSLIRRQHEIGRRQLALERLQVGSRELVRVVRD